MQGKKGAASHITHAFLHRTFCHLGNHRHIMRYKHNRRTGFLLQSINQR